MYNKDVERSIEDCQIEMGKLEILMEQFGNITPICNYLTKYAAIRCCGTFEQGYKSIIADYYESFSDKLANFITIHVREASANPTYTNICSVLTSFDESKCKEFKNKVSHLPEYNKITTSLDSLNKNRNSVAHGKDNMSSFKEIKEYFTSSLEVLNCLDEACH